MSNIEVVLQTKRPEENSKSPLKQLFPMRKADHFGFTEVNMDDSVQLDAKDKSFFFKKSNKKEEILEISMRSKEKANGFRVDARDLSVIFKDVIEFSGEKINQAKRNCLLNKGVIYNDHEIQFGFISNVFYHKEEILLKVTIYFGNLSEDDIHNFDVSFIGNSSKISIFFIKILIKCYLSDKPLDEIKRKQCNSCCKNTRKTRIDNKI